MGRDVLSKETQQLLVNMTGSLDLQLPSIYHYLPHLLGNPFALQPAYKLAKGRAGGNYHDWRDVLCFPLPIFLFLSQFESAHFLSYSPRLFCGRQPSVSVVLYGMFVAFTGEMLLINFVATKWNCTQRLWSCDRNVGGDVIILADNCARFCPPSKLL